MALPRSVLVCHYQDIIMNSLSSQITSLTIVYSTVYSRGDQRKHQSSASLAFVWGIHRGPVNSPHKGPVTRKMFPFDDVIMPRNEVWNYRVTGPHYYIHFVIDHPFWCRVRLCHENARWKQETQWQYFNNKMLFYSSFVKTYPDLKWAGHQELSWNK